MVLFSFWQRTSDLDIVTTWSLENYANFFNNPAYVRTLVKTIGIGVLVTATCLVMAFAIAYFLARYVSRRWARFALIVIIVPFWTSYLLRVYSWQAILGEHGALNQVLMAIGLISEPSFLFVYNDAGTFLVLVYLYIPFADACPVRSARPVRLHAADGRPGPGGTARPGLPPDPAATDPAGSHHRLHIRVHPDPRRVPDALDGRRCAGIADREPDRQLLQERTDPRGCGPAFMIAALVTLLLVVFRRYLRIEDVFARGLAASIPSRSCPSAATRGGHALGVADLVRPDDRFLYLPIVFMVVFSFDESRTPGLPITGFTLHVVRGDAQQSRAHAGAWEYGVRRPDRLGAIHASARWPHSSCPRRVLSERGADLFTLPIMVPGCSSAWRCSSSSCAPPISRCP